MAETSDRETLRLLRRRDPRGFDLAYASYAAKIHAFLVRLAGGGGSALAQDLLQQTFLRLAERGPELRADSDLRAWLFTVARNAFLGHARQNSRERQADGLELMARHAPDAEARLMLGDVERALGELRLEDREVLLLVGVEGLEPHTVSMMLQVSPTALRKRLERARQRLLAALERLPQNSPEKVRQSR